jgi:hypothetical protein
MRQGLRPLSPLIGIVWVGLVFARQDERNTGLAMGISLNIKLVKNHTLENSWLRAKLKVTVSL